MSETAELIERLEWCANGSAFAAEMRQACVRLAALQAENDRLMALEPVARAALRLDSCASEFDGDMGICGEYLDGLWTACGAYRSALAPKGEAS